MERQALFFWNFLLGTYRKLIRHIIIKLTEDNLTSGIGTSKRLIYSNMKKRTYVTVGAVKRNTGISDLLRFLLL